MSNCPKCLRPFNEGNSPNEYECNGTDDDEGVCEAYAKLAALKTRIAELELTEKFYKLAIKERDYERVRVDRVEKERDEAIAALRQIAKGGSSDDAYLIATEALPRYPECSHHVRTWERDEYGIKREECQDCGENHLPPKETP
jgi:hypothetical protein